LPEWRSNGLLKNPVQVSGEEGKAPLESPLAPGSSGRPHGLRTTSSKEAGLFVTGFVDRWKSWTKALRTEVFALSLAYKDPRTPRHAKIVAACVVAYAFSPIDLIPDPIPVLGYLDDILILPFGIALAIKLIPPGVMEDARRRAKEGNASGRLVSRAGAVLVIGIWLLVALLVTAWAWRVLRG